MPTFPVPRHPVPCCLNPLNPKHWCLVVFWIYCCPSALKYYLYQAAPTFYRAKTRRGLLHSWQIESYRNLYLCLGPAITMVVLGLSIPSLLIFKWSTVAWSSGLLGLWIGLLAGAIHFVVYSLPLSAKLSHGAGITGGLTIGVAVGISNSLILAIVLGASSNWSASSLLGPDIGLYHFGFIVFYTLAVSVPSMLSLEGLIGSFAGLLTGLASGGVTGVFLRVLTTALPSVELTALALAVTVGLSCLGCHGMVASLAGCLLYELFAGLTIGIAIGAGLYQSGVAFDPSVLYALLAILIIWVGVLRLVPLQLVYGFYALTKLLPGVTLKSHPIAWDELLIMPVPGAQTYLEALLSRDEEQGIRLLIALVKNPFQRPMVQRVFKKHLLEKNEFIKALYIFLDSPLGNVYVIPPVSPSDWELLPTSRQVLLGELSSKWVNTTVETSSENIEKFLASMTWFHRNHQDHAYIDFSKLLYRISYTFKAYTQLSNLEQLTPNYAELLYRPGGPEVIDSFKAIVTFSSYKYLHQLSTAHQEVANLPTVQQAIRPDIIKTLRILADIAADISVAQNSRSLLLQQSSLLRANDALERLRQKIVADITLPEAKLLEIIAGRWQKLVRESGGEVGNLTKLPPLLKNPYIIGTPVSGGDFIGRDDILRYIADELLAGTKQCPSIVLYGHRRMGKTSILKNLPLRLKSTNIKVVDFNMQVLGHVSSTHELLYALARQMCRAIGKPELMKQLSVDRAAFMEQNPYHALNSYFQRLEQTLTAVAVDYRFVIAIDEFEKIEEKIINRKLSEDLLEFLRGLTQTYCWFSVIFAGLHTIEELCFDYWSPFFTSIPICVSFLSAEATEQLILQAGDIAYENDVVSEIIRLTNGQPYLVQLIGYTLIRFFNRSGLKKAVKRSEYPVFNVDDLNQLIQSAEFYTIGNAYFQGVWLQALHGHPPEQASILRQLAHQPRSQAQLAQRTGLPKATVETALQALQNHDVLQREGEIFTYTVELMRRWVHTYQL